MVQTAEAALSSCRFCLLNFKQNISQTHEHRCLLHRSYTQFESENLCQIWQFSNRFIYAVLIKRLGSNCKTINGIWTISFMQFYSLGLNQTAEMLKASKRFRLLSSIHRVWFKAWDLFQHSNSAAYWNRTSTPARQSDITIAALTRRSWWGSCPWHR